MHRIAVIGRGLIGSAAARHLAENMDGIACIGPDEPENHQAHTGVFASHYDEGRMTRCGDPTPEWSITAGQAIRRYRDLERRSGIRFYSPVGYLGLGHPGSTHNARCAANGVANGARIERLDAPALRARYPYLSVSAAADGLIESGGAGHISPRRMVEAQTVLAERAGAACIRQAARAVRAASKGVEIKLWDGSSVTAEKALITAGSFTQACGLSPVDLGLIVFGRTVVLVRIEGEIKEVLRDMPTMIVARTGAYILPPIRYSDGHSYLKIGIGHESDPRFTTLGGLQTWFRGNGAKTDRVAFTARSKTLFPVLNQCPAWHTNTCAITQTPTGLPVIDFVDGDRIAVAVGGCGKGAKGADEWGRIAAGVVSGQPWSSEVSREKLSFRT
ncbi:MAG: FAD-binding oxidoreductase [Rhodobacteraceae bacterium]|nr:FAD-binding oxidoreductase [Paracoccaceae bacterium]